MGFGYGLQVFNIMFTLVFLLVISTFVVTAVRGFSQWNKNNNSPRLTVEATVVTKRTNVSRRRSSNDMHRTSTSYYATFQFDSGDRLELSLQGHEYGLIVEGDKGKLTFQGTRYLGFERT